MGGKFCLRWIMIFLLLFLLCGCSVCPSDHDVAYINNSMPFIANKKYGLRCEDAAYEGESKTRTYLLEFSTHKIYNVDQARRLMVDLTEDLICLGKDHPVVYNCIETPPLSEKHTSFIINFLRNDKCYMDSVVSFKGKMYFSRMNADGRLEFFASETYREAYFKVYGQNPPERE